MKRMRFIGTAALALLLAGSTAYAQDRGDNDRGRSGGGRDRSAPRGGGDRQGSGDRGPRSGGDRSGSDRNGGNRNGSDRGRSGNDRGDRSGRSGNDRSGSDRNGRDRNGGDRNGGFRSGDRNGGFRSGDRNDYGRSGSGRVQLRATPDRRRQWNSARSDSWRSHRASDFLREHRSWRARGGYRGYRIPSTFFRANFGRSHYFRVRSLPFVVVGGRPSFQYDGYWFDIVDPYPEYWGDDWYDSDDVYVDYVDDGYYLFNRRFPDRPGIAINIRL
jgi:hypothetical protein